MNKILTLLTILLLASCSKQKQDLSIYFEPKNDLQKAHLLGKLKSVDWFTVTIDETGKERISKIASQEYNKEGNLISKNGYRNGELKVKYSFVYDSRNLLINKKSVHIGANEFQEEYTYYQDSTIKTRSFVTGDEVSTATYFYDQFKNPEKVEYTTNKEKEVSFYVNKYNQYNKLISVTQSSKMDTVSTYLEYDKQARLTELTTVSSKFGNKIQYLYEGDNLESMKKFNNELFLERLYFDANFNIIKRNHNAKIVFFDYEFDYNGNWIKQKNSEDEMSFVVREIKYY
jgi:hypothetical protein